MVVRRLESNEILQIYLHKSVEVVFTHNTKGFFYAPE